VFRIGVLSSFAKRSGLGIAAGAAFAITQLPGMKTSWILRERGFGTRSMFEVALKKTSSFRPLISGLSAVERGRAAVERGDCATAISDLVVAQSPAAGMLHRVKIDKRWGRRRRE
jgi:molybdate-binding protein